MESADFVISETERKALRYFSVTLLCVASAFFQAALFLNTYAAMLSVVGSVFSLALYTRI
jgi:hypothetical protein